MSQNIISKLKLKCRSEVFPLLRLPAINLSSPRSIDDNRKIWELVEAYTILFSEGAGRNALMPSDYLRNVCENLGLQLSSYQAVTINMIRNSRNYPKIKRDIYQQIASLMQNDEDLALQAYLQFIYEGGLNFECDPILHPSFVVCPWNNSVNVDERTCFTFGQGSCVVIIVKSQGKVVRLSHLPAKAVIGADNANTIKMLLPDRHIWPALDEIIVSHFFVGRAYDLISEIIESHELNCEIIGIRKSEHDQFSYRIDNLDHLSPVKILINSRLIYGVSPYDTGAAFLPRGQFRPIEQLF